MSHDEVVRLLLNWQRWAATAFPELGVQPPPWADQWIPRLAWDSGWGDPVPLDAPEPEINDADGNFIDRAIMRLPVDYIEILKRHYIGVLVRRPSGMERQIVKQEPEKLDPAIRSLGDVIQRYRDGLITDRPRG